MLLTAANTCQTIEGVFLCGGWGVVNLHKTLEAGKWKMSIEAAARAESGAQ